MREPIDEHEEEFWDKIADHCSREALISLICWNITGTITGVDLEENIVHASLGYDFDWELTDSIEYWELVEIGRGESIDYSASPVWIVLRFTGYDDLPMHFKEKMEVYDKIQEMS